MIFMFGNIEFVRSLIFGFYFGIVCYVGILWVNYYEY